MSFEITFLPEGRKLSVRPGTTVLDAARKARVHIRTRCGGKAGCLMCKVTHISEGGLSMMGDAEQRKLADMEGSGIRLSCQAKVTGNVIVEVPEDPLKSAVRKMLAKQQEEDDRLW